jgi:hypothetical protein
MRTDDAAIEVMREKGRATVWYGDPDLIANIAERAGHNPLSHPLNRSAAVMRALALSPKFKLAGYIEHLGHKYPVREPIKEPQA